MMEHAYRQVKIFLAMLLIGIALITAIYYFSDDKQAVAVIDYLIPESVRDIKSPQITWDDVALYDSTVYNSEENKCYGQRYGMNIEVSPCIAYDVDGKGIEQEVKFKWTGNQARDISWIFVYDNQLSDGKIYALRNVSKTIQLPENTWINNYLVDKVVSYVNLTSAPQSCDLGNLNNTRFYNVTRTTNNATTYVQTICFSQINIINSTAFRISGNANIPQDKIFYASEYVDVTDKVQYLGKGLLNDNRSYYKVEDVTFNVGQEIITKWKFSPKDFSKRGKWHILGYDSNTGLVQSVINNEYIYLDPWWSSSWTKKKALIVTERSGIELFNYTFNFSVTYDSDMQGDFDDLRFLDSTESVELPYWIESKTDSTSAMVFIRYAERNLTASANTTIYMYYGNPSATSNSNKNTTFLLADDFGGLTIDTNKWDVYSASGHVTVNNGAYLYVTGNGVNTAISSKSGVQKYPIKMEYDLIINTIGSPSYATFYGFGNASQSNQYTYANWGVRTSAQGWGVWSSALVDYLWTDASSTDSVPKSAYNYGTTYKMKFVQNTYTNRTSYRNNTLLVNYIRFLNNTDYPVFIAQGGGTGQTINFTIKNVRVSSYANTEPAVTVGAEQSSEGLTVTSNSPNDSYKTNNTNITFSFTVNPTSVNITNWTLFVWYSNNSIAHQHESGDLNLNNTLNVNHSDTLFSDNNYIWTVKGCGYSSSTGTHICSYSGNRTFQVHTTAPQFSLSSLPNVTTLSLPTNNTFLIISADPELSSCRYWTSENSTRIPYTCNSTQSVNFTTGGTKTIYVSANDTFGNTNDTSYNFRIYDFNISQYENADPIAEGSTSHIYLYANSTSFPIVDASAVITWNGTQHSATKTVIDANTILFDYTFIVSSGLGNSTGKTYSYNWTYNTTEITTRTTPTTTQTVVSFGVDDCSVYTIPITNISLKDEESAGYVSYSNASSSLIEVEALIRSNINTGVTWSYAQKFSNQSSVKLCVPAGSLNSSNYTIDLTIGYESTGRVREFYFLDNGTLANNYCYFNSYTSCNINLYDLATADSTTFLFEYTDDLNQEVPDAIVHTFRKYIGEGLFREVERSRDDDNGQTHVHLVEEDVIYYFQVSQYGNIIYTSSTYNAKCLSAPCTISLSASPQDTNWTIVDNEGGKYEVITDKNTRIASVVFQLDSPATVNATLYKYSGGKVEMINSTTAYSTGTTINLNVPIAYGNDTFFVAIYKNGEFVKSSWADLSTSGRTFFGESGAIYGGLIVMAVVLMAVSEGVGLIIFTSFALILITIMALVELQWLAIISLITAGGIIVWKLIRRRRVA